MDSLKVCWCRQGESNSRPTDYESVALPLSYAGAEAGDILEQGAGRNWGHQSGDPQENLLSTTLYSPVHYQVAG